MTVLHVVRVHRRRGQRAGWYQTTYGDHGGYVSADYVTAHG